MWPFRNPSKPQVDPLGPLVKDVAELQDDMRRLKLEWEDTYERVHRALARLNKRARDAAAAEEARQDAPGATISPEVASYPAPIPMDPISAAIHARRARALQTRPNGSEG